MKYWVTCTDPFLSGWGEAENRISKFVIECDTYEEAQIVKYNLTRPYYNFKYVNIRIHKPNYPTDRYHTSIKTFAECTAYNHL